MTIDKERLNETYNAVIAWGTKGKGRGTVVAPTGFGKTFIGIIAILKHFNIDSTNSVRIIVPSEAAERVWIDNIPNFKLLSDMLEIAYPENRKLDITTINKVMNNPPKDKVTLLLIDEIHKFSSEERMKIFNYAYFEYKFILGLTGTFPAKGDLRKVLDMYCPEVYRINEQESIDNKWTADFIEYNLPCYLSTEEQILYDKYTKYMSDIITMYDLGKDFLNSLPADINNVFELIKVCTTGKKYKENGNWRFCSSTDYRELIAKNRQWSRNIDVSVAYWAEIDRCYSPNNTFKYCEDYMRYMRKRNSIMNDAQCKIDKCIEIFRKFDKVKTITFGQSTEFATRLTEATNFQLGNDYTPVHDFALSTGEHTIQLKKPIAIAYHSMLKSKPVIDPKTGQYYRTKAGKIKMFGLKTFKDEAIEGLKVGRYRIINTASALDESFDVSDLGLAIITGGDRNNIKQEQRAGRAKRLDFNNPNGTVYIINLYLKDTIEVRKIKDRQTSNRVVWINDINEII